MQVYKLDNKNYGAVLALAVKALKQGKTVVYPTDTAYALGALIKNQAAINKIYKIKHRTFKKPVHVLSPSVSAAKKYLVWNSTAEKLAKKFLPGPLSLVLLIKPTLKFDKKVIKKLSANSGYLGIRVAKNKFALDLAKKAGVLTATSANPAKSVGGQDPYSVQSILKQFKNHSNKPDIIIDAGALKHILPSTLVKITDKGVEILRKGPITEKQIYNVLR